MHVYTYVGDQNKQLILSMVVIALCFCYCCDSSSLKTSASRLVLRCWHIYPLPQDASISSGLPLAGRLLMEYTVIGTLQMSKYNAIISKEIYRLVCLL